MFSLHSLSLSYNRRSHCFVTFQRGYGAEYCIIGQYIRNETLNKENKETDPILMWIRLDPIPDPKNFSELLQITVFQKQPYSNMKKQK